MLQAVLNLYELLYERAVNEVPEDAGYIRDIHREWKAQLETMTSDLNANQTLRLSAVSDRVVANLRGRMSKSALVEWLDAYPSAVEDIVETP